MSSSPLAGVRQWRTAILTLRDETSTLLPASTIISLIGELIDSHSHDLLDAAAALPAQEVMSDLMLLAQLATSADSSCCNMTNILARICHLIHDVSRQVHLEINSSSWAVMLNFIEKIMNSSPGNTNIKTFPCCRAAGVKEITEILEFLRPIQKSYGRKSSLMEDEQLVRLLLSLVSDLHTELLTFYHSSGNCQPAADTKVKTSRCMALWGLQAVAFSMIHDVIYRLNSSISSDSWLSTLEVFRKVTDFMASKSPLIESNTMSRFYTTLLQCLHLVLSDPKGSLSGHVSGFLATLQMFFVYGLRSRFSQSTMAIALNNSSSSLTLGHNLVEAGKTVCRTYRPPHMRRREHRNVHLSSSPSTSDSESSKYNLSSDSDHSDSDMPGKGEDYFQSSNARVSAIMCIKDLCQADPKSLSSIWTMVLPDTDVLQPRNCQPNLFSCLIFDPVLKVRLASSSTLSSMLVGHSLTFLQVAEFKESSKCGSFTTLSTSLGQSLMQLHRGMIYMIQQETHNKLLLSLLEVLMLLISATPYTRFPGEMLPTIIRSLCTRIMKDLVFKTREVHILVSALGCLVAALSNSPPSLNVLKMLKEKISRDVVHHQRNTSVIYVLLEFVENGKHPSVRYEALQALKALLHNYPTMASTLWDHISSIIYSLLQMPYSCNFPEVDYSLLKGDIAKVSGATPERCIIAAIKVLDECLRAASGFVGTDDLLESRLLDIQLQSDRTIKRRVSSAPLHDLNAAKAPAVNVNDFSYGNKLWYEVIERHLPLALSHSSVMVRTASIFCFAGMTSSVFFSLSDEKQQYVVACTVTSAHNEIPSVKSAACRAIGVISCFPGIFRSARLFNDYIHAVVVNIDNALASVRITASWALANICDSLRYTTSNFKFDCSKDTEIDSSPISLLVECALRLTKDADKIKANAVRALGSLSQFIRFAHYTGKEPDVSVHAYYLPCKSCTCNEKSSNESACSSMGWERVFCTDAVWLERMVQVFLSCVTTGNVKVQWNVCHALGNLLANPTLILHSMPWTSTVYSILLLLLRESDNYKIRIHAAIALTVPESRIDYGPSFSDVVHGIQHVLELQRLDQDTTPLSFKYKDNFEKQLTMTTLHVLSFLSAKDDDLKHLLVKKACLLEEWIKSHWCIMESDNTSLANNDGSRDVPPSYIAKKELFYRAVTSLVQFYEGKSHHKIAQKFQQLLGG